MVRLPNWAHPRVPGMRTRGRGTVEDNFASEIRGLVDIFMREANQNPLDARKPGFDGPVEVKFRLLRTGQFDRAYLDSLITEDYIRRLNASSSTRKPFTPPTDATVLVVEDFGTTGLEGTASNPDIEGRKQNWNAFWFREGIGEKQNEGSNGRAGQGKITYYRMSNVRAVFGYTVRASDQQHMLMGKCCFRQTYHLDTDGPSYERDGFWCDARGDNALPLTDEKELLRFRTAFQLERESQSGLSIVIPFSQDFSATDALRTVVSDFYFAVKTGRLAVTIDDVRVDATSLPDICALYFTDEVARARGSSFTNGYRSFIDGIVISPPAMAEAKPTWRRTPSLKEEHFPDGAVASLREDLAAGKSISVRFPLQVRPVGQPPVSTFLDVFLQLPLDLESSEEAYIRQELLIGAEEQLRRDRTLPAARGLTYISHPGLSAFMADAEEPTHMKWNASRPRLAEDYEVPKETVAAVRGAMPKLLAMLANVASRRDTRILASLFARPTPENAKRTSGGGGQQQKEGIDRKDVDNQISRRKPFKWDHGTTWDRVFATAADTVLPVEATIEYAYLGLDDDAFSAYDPFDFDLSDGKQYPVAEAVGCEILMRTLNRIEVRVTSVPFALKVDGFDPNVRRRTRITYTDGATVNGPDNIDE